MIERSKERFNPSFAICTDQYFKQAVLRLVCNSFRISFKLSLLPVAMCDVEAIVFVERCMWRQKLQLSWIAKNAA